MKNQIYQIIKSSDKALSLDDLYKIVKEQGIGLGDLEQGSQEENDKNGNSLVNILYELIGDGLVFKSKKGKYMSSRSCGLYPATIVSLSEGFAFATFVEKDDMDDPDVFIAGRNLKSAIPGDLVLIKITSTPKGYEGVVDQILKNGENRFFGEAVYNGRQLEFNADKIIRYPVPIVRTKASKGLRNREKVCVSLVYANSRKPSAKIEMTFGFANRASVCTKALIEGLGIATEFKPELIEEAEKINKIGIPSDEIEKRLDLRDKIIFTIDGADAKDLDDAVSLEKTPTGYKLGVHIADVSYYVKDGSPLDEEALNRGTSIYFANQVVPMYPKEISNGICSLNAHQDKLAFSAFMDIDEDGKLLGYKFVKSIIDSKVRGVYNEVNSIFDGTASEEIETKYKDVKDTLFIMKDLAEKMQKNGIKRGIMEFETEESQFILNEKDEIVDIKVRERGFAERMIEQFMLTANESAALYAKSVEIPFVYRTHERPDEDKIMILLNMAQIMGFNVSFIKRDCSGTHLAKLLNEAEGTKYMGIISKLMVRSMAKAVYSTEPTGHFGLSLDDYCHFTSPIRRYPDTFVHRMLSQLVAGKTPEKITNKYKIKAEIAASESTKNEINAMGAERQCEDCYKAEFMLKYVGDTFVGIVSSVVKHGVYVRLNNTVEGLVRADNLPGGTWIYDGNISFVNTTTKKKITIGDELKIMVAKSEVSSGKVEFVTEE